MRFLIDILPVVCYNPGMDSFEKPIFTDIAVPKNNEVNTADFLRSSPWGDCDITFTWTNSDFNALHNHNHWELFVIANGKITHSINGGIFTLSRGDAYLVRPRDVHCFKNPDSNYQQINFLIKSEFLRRFLSAYIEGLYEELLSEKSPLAFRIPENLLQSGIYKMLSLQTVQGNDVENHVFHTKLIFDSLLQSFFDQRYSYTEAYPQWFKNLLNELNKPNAYQLPTDEIVKLTPYSYSRLCYLFKKHTGKTLNEYMLGLKLLHAKEQLRFTGLTTLEISGEIGFSSLSHFNHIFKKTFGMTPSEYRAGFRN